MHLYCSAPLFYPSSTRKCRKLESRPHPAPKFNYSSTLNGIEGIQSIGISKAYDKTRVVSFDELVKHPPQKHIPSKRQLKESRYVPQARAISNTSSTYVQSVKYLTTSTSSLMVRYFHMYLMNMNLVLNC